MELTVLSRRLGRSCEMLRFVEPVSYVYNPVEYAWATHRMYLEKYGKGTKRVLFLGMNPGPFGMAQTGVPFGDPVAVRDFLGIEGPVGRPVTEHRKRPVLGFESTRREISGKRLWTWVADRYGTAEAFFQDRFVWNYCPLMFLQDSGRNFTPNRLLKKERIPLFALCDEALSGVVNLLDSRVVVAVGRFAAERAREALADQPVEVVRIPHPSGANPQASHNWGGQVDAILNEAGVE